MATRPLSGALCRAEGDVGRDDGCARSREKLGIHAGSAADRDCCPAIEPTAQRVDTAPELLHHKELVERRSPRGALDLELGKGLAVEVGSLSGLVKIALHQPATPLVLRRVI